MKWRWLVDYLLLGVLLAVIGLGASVGIVALLAWLLPGSRLTAVLTLLILCVIAVSLLVVWQRFNK